MALGCARCDMHAQNGNPFMGVTGGMSGLGACYDDGNGYTYCDSVNDTTETGTTIIPYGTAAGTMSGPNPTPGQLAVGGAVTTSNSSNTSLLNSIASLWAQTGAKIALAAGGAQPTFTTTSPTGATTSYYGNPSYLSQLPASLTSMFSTPAIGGMSIGTLLLVGGAVLLVMNMSKK